MSSDDSQKPSNKERALKYLIQNSGTRPLISKNNKLDHKYFDEKFSKALTKTLTLKGLDLKITESSSQAIHLPQLSNFPSNIHINSFYNSKGPLGLIAFDELFLSQLIHKMLGGSDKIKPGPLKLPLSPLQQKVLDSFNPALANCLREGVKNILGLESLHIKAATDSIEIETFLNQGGDSYLFHYSFSALVESSIIVLLLIKNFDSLKN